MHALHTPSNARTYACMQLHTHTHIHAQNGYHSRKRLGERTNAQGNEKEVEEYRTQRNKY